MSGALSLFTIEASLQMLLDTRLGAEEEGDEGALREIDKAIAEYMALEVKKVDGIANAYRAYGAAAAQAELEADRLMQRAKQLHCVAERIKEWAKTAMEAHQVTRIETPLNRLRIQKNGGVMPLEVTDETALPQAVKKAKITLPAEDWAFLRQGIIVGLAPAYRLALGRCIESSEVDNVELRKALTMKVQCPNCAGKGELCPAGPSDAPMGPCQTCEKTGLIPVRIPGARLLERGTHLRVE